MIEVRGLSKDYGSTLALRGVDLHVPCGEFCVVLGPSGAGKSTLLRCINRLIEPGTGEVRIGGQKLSGERGQLREIRRHLGMIFQDHNLVPRLSVLKNVLTGRLASMPVLTSLLQWFPQADIDIAMQCLGRVELADKAYSRADRLSGGQQQRVGIARALAQQPGAILADEPVASLDPKTARVVLGDLRSAARVGHRSSVQPSPVRIRQGIRRSHHRTVVRTCRVRRRAGDIGRTRAGADISRPGAT
jgi:phosphonate transport system ATP-binding protein